MTIYKQKNRRGLALIELVIVLGVVGIIVGAIWAAASTVREKEQVHDTVQIISDIAGRVRSLYTGFPNAAAPTDIATQIAREFYPASVVDTATNKTINSWDGDYLVTFDKDPSVGAGFSVLVNMNSTISAELRRDVCLGLLTRIRGYATNYPQGDTSGTWPGAAQALPFEPTQGMGPALAFVKNVGGWQHVTTSTVVEMTDFIKGAGGCQGVAFYYKM